MTNEDFALGLADLLGISAPGDRTALVDLVGDWTGGEMTPMALANRISQFVSLVSGRDMDLSEWAHGTVNGGPDSDGEYPIRIQGGGVITLPSPAKMTSSTQKGDPGGVRYIFSTSTTEADPGDGRLRFNHATPASVTHLYYDNLEANGGFMAPWFASFGHSTSAGKGLLILQQGSAGQPLVYRVTAAPVAKAGFYDIAVTHVAGAVAPDNNSGVTSLFAPTGDRGASLLYGAGEPDAGAGVVGDVYLRLDTGDYFGPKTGGGWGAAIPQTTVASLLAQTISARDTTITKAGEAAADRVQTGLDRVQTTADAGATAADRVQTGLDRAQTTADAGATAADRVQTGLDRAQTTADAGATAADRVQTGLDRIAAANSADDAATAAALVDGPAIDARLVALEAGQVSIESSLRSDVLWLMLLLAEQRLDQVGTPHGWADLFEDQDGVDLAASSGEFYDAVGKAYNGLAKLPPMTANNAPAGHEVAADSEDAGQGAWKAADAKTSGTLFVTAAGGSAPHWWRRKMPAGYIVGAYRFQWGNYGYPTSWKLQGATSTSGPWTDLHTVSSVSPSPNQWTPTYAVSTPAYYDYVRLYVSAYDTGMGGQMAIRDTEFVNAATPADMDLRSVALGAFSTPSRASLIVAAASSGAITPGVNLKGYASRTDGANWTEVTLQARDTVGGFTMYEALGADISGQPAGSDMRWRVETIGSEIIDIGAVALAWS